MIYAREASRVGEWGGTFLPLRRVCLHVACSNDGGRGKESEQFRNGCDSDDISEVIEDKPFFLYGNSKIVDSRTGHALPYTS